MIYKKDNIHDQIGIISGMQGWFNTGKLMQICINRIEEVYSLLTR